MRYIYLVCTICAVLFIQSCAPKAVSEPIDKTLVVMENIFARKSVRAYKADANGNPMQISKDTLEQIVKAGMAAPTGKNKQPWEFFVLDNREPMAKLAEQLPYAKMLSSASAAIVVVGNPEVSDYWYLDCSAAAENILLAIESMGLGGVWTAGYPYEDRMSNIKDALNIPDPYLPLCLIPIGYPAKEEKPKDKWKPEKVHYNVW